MSTILNATEVTVRYGERAILDSATLAIDEGQRIGLVGRNGCGKTTFLKLLAGLQAPDSVRFSRAPLLPCGQFRVAPEVKFLRAVRTSNSSSNSSSVLFSTKS